MKDTAPFVLLAEDDTDDQELIVSAFLKADPNLKMAIVNDGKEALDYLLNASEGKLPCLILLDYNMPELNGAQVVQKLSDARFKNIPKVILSTSNNPVYAEDSLKKGASAYRVKPDDFQSLINIAKEMIALCRNAA
ncbi:MAG: response regulator [Flavisolibacter sp.]|nr:response regulator [Flavisolibacter sp.]